jgi:hypothetical protein
VTTLDPVEELVWGLADAVARSTQAVLPTVPLKSHDEYTFVHSVNVSLLVLAQARGFGFEGPSSMPSAWGPAARRRQSSACRSTS